MKLKLIIPALLLTTLLGAQGIRKEAGNTFLEPLQKRDSVLIADQFRYGIILENVPEGTPLAFPEFKPEKDSPLEILGEWQLDSTRISKKKEVPARYNIKASLILTAFDGGIYELPDIPVLMDGDTLVFHAPEEPLEVKELPIDMETFQAHDIKPQVKFPYTFKEIFPWVLAALGFIGLVLIACCPGGSSSNVFSKLAGGDVALSVTLTAISSVVTLFTIPLIMSWATALVGESVGITLPVGNLIKQNLLLMLLPVVLGIGMNYAWPEAARKTDKVLGKLAFPLLLVLITVFYIQHHKTILEHIGILGLCVTVRILVAISCSSLLSRLVRTGEQQRRTVVIEVGMQNAAQAIAIASSPFIFANEKMAIPAILYSLMMNIVLLIYVGIVRMASPAFL